MDSLKASPAGYQPALRCQLADYSVSGRLIRTRGRHCKGRRSPWLTSTSCSGRLPVASNSGQAAESPFDEHPLTSLRSRFHRTKKRVTKKEKLAALKRSEPVVIDQIRRLLALPPDRRTNFLRRRIGFRLSCL